MLRGIQQGNWQCEAARPLFTIVLISSFHKSCTHHHPQAVYPDQLAKMMQDSSCGLQPAPATKQSGHSATLKSGTKCAWQRLKQQPWPQGPLLAPACMYSITQGYPTSCSAKSISSLPDSAILVCLVPRCCQQQGSYPAKSIHAHAAAVHIKTTKRSLVRCPT